MKKQRRKHTAEFKARIALEAIKGLDTINEIAAKYEVHPVQVGNWKKELLDRVPELFERRNASKNKDGEQERAQLSERLATSHWLEFYFHVAGGRTRIASM